MYKTKIFCPAAVSKKEQRAFEKRCKETKPGESPCASCRKCNKTLRKSDDGSLVEYTAPVTFENK